ncbi:MAG: hypothetical protein HKN30_15740 [Sulfitobacter sp.]|nr:hypothetical protein [Sulfitobacter sp.]
MIGRLSGAATRGFLVALLIATPALMLPEVKSDSSQFVVLIALLAGFLTFVEYNSNFPSIIEFRDAPPFNRLRFSAIFLSVFMLAALISHQTNPTGMTGAVNSLGVILGNALDFPYSPVRLAVLMLPPDASPQMVNTLRMAAGISHFLSILGILIFFVCIRFLNWPTRRGAFNVWVNLPLFDPTAGRDVVYRLQRDARINITLGFLLPFVIPAWVKLFSIMINPVSLTNPQTLIWTLSAWAFLPTSMIMRGLAMAKVASMITDKRRRAYADAEADGDFQAA